MNLIPLPAFSDNYIWLLQHQGLALVVDPGDSTPVDNWLAANNHKLDCILVTHHHGDHTGGVAKLQQHWGAKVYGPAHEKLPFEFQALAQGNQFSWLGLNFQTLDVPGHTAGHIAYFAEPDGQELCFFVVTRFSLVAAVACLRALHSRCSIHWIGWPHCQALRAFAAPTSTH